MQSSIPLSQYLCRECGSVLRETAAEIEINSVNEECPDCGAVLAQSLTRRSKDGAELKPLQLLPKVQTAYDLLRFNFGIEKLDSIMRLGSSGSLCIVGHKANLMLTRLCVRALLPARFGGLDSPYVMVVDAGNKSDLYQTVNFARQYHMNIDNTLDRIIVNRPFTIHQLKKLIAVQVPKDVQQYQLKAVVILGLLDLFDDPNIKKREANRLIARIMKSMEGLAEKVLVMSSMQEGRLADLVAPSFEKRIVMKNTKNHRLLTQLYGALSHDRITLIERELRLCIEGQTSK